MSTEETALTVFQSLEVPATLQAKIMELDPDFATRPETEQREVLGFLLEQAEKTTEGVRSRFPQIKLKHAGAKCIEMPREVGQEDNEIVREFEGVILDQFLTKAYWENEDDANGAPPDCASLDSVNPYSAKPVTTPDQGGCLSCPFNKFGSATKGKGKRCRDIKRVIIALDGHELPARLNLSAMNLRPFDGYLNDLRDMGLTIGSVRTKFRAVGAQNAAGTEYTGLELSTVAKLTIPQLLELKRGKVDPFKADFRMGQIEADTDQVDEGAGPSRANVEAGQRAAKATEVM